LAVWTGAKSGSIGSSSSHDGMIPDLCARSSAGVGRTGTFIALSSLLLPPMVQGSDTLAGLPVSPLGPLPSSVEDDEIARTVDQFREWRGMLVQGPDQLRLIYEVVGVQTRHAL